MEPNTILELVGSYGFPVLCCIYMMTTMNKTLKEHTEKTSEMMSTLQTSLTSNTEAINHLSTFITSFIKPSGSDNNE